MDNNNIFNSCFSQTINRIPIFSEGIYAGDLKARNGLIHRLPRLPLDS